MGHVLALLGGFGTLAGSFVALTLLYKLLPNTLVRWRPAIAGALRLGGAVGGLEVGLRPLREPWPALSQALRRDRSHPAVPVLAVLNWLIVLFGIEIAFTLQAIHGRVFEFERTTRRGALLAGDPQWLLPLVVAIARVSREGQPVSRQLLAEELDLRLSAVAELVGRLESEGLVLQVTSRSSDDIGLTLALPPERIPLARIVALASRFTLGDTPREGSGWQALAALHETARSAAGERTVADLL